jgi:hypothetical protein
LIDDPILLQTELNIAIPRASHPQQPYPLMHSLSNLIRRKRRRRRQLLLLTPRTQKFAKLRSFINKNCNDVKWVVRKTTPDSTIDRDVAKACQQQA